MNVWIAGLLFIIISLITGLIGAQFEPGMWYELIVRPAWIAPNWLYAPVWTALYILMGVGAGLAWGVAGWRFPHNLFVIQLIFNSAWFWLFFGLHRTGWALGEMALLWVLVLATMIGFWRLQRWAGILMLPYLLWLTYTLALNFQIWRTHGGALPF